MIGDATEGSHPVVAVNDTRNSFAGEVAVKDADSGKILFSGHFDVPANGKQVVGSLPAISGQAMWLVEYSSGNEKYNNHYLSGKAPFKLTDYIRWYRKLNIHKK